jgi:AhpC/TSA family
MALTKTSICNFGWKARDFALKGIDGKTYTLAGVRGPKGTLVAFICNHCPYVKASVGRIVAEANALRETGIGTLVKARRSRCPRWDVRSNGRAEGGGVRCRGEPFDLRRSNFAIWPRAARANLRLHQHSVGTATAATIAAAIPILASQSAGEIEQLPHHPLHLIILAFASMLEDDFSAPIENVLRRPILVSIGVPRGVFIVLRDWVVDAVALEGGLQVGS